MELVILESPYAAPTPEEVQKHIRYARLCLNDSLSRGEAPIASHLLYTQPGVLDDTIPEERQQGIDAGLAWRRVADKTVVYCDFGITKGMQYGIKLAEEQGNTVEYRKILDDVEPDVNSQVALSGPYEIPTDIPLNNMV